MPSFEEELTRQIGGWGHVRFGRSYRFAAGYVCILVATLASICLAQFSYVERSGVDAALAFNRFSGLWSSATSLAEIPPL